MFEDRKKIEELTKTFLQLLRDQVVVRYEISRPHGRLHYEARLLTICNSGDVEYLVAVWCMVNADKMRVDCGLQASPFRMSDVSSNGVEDVLHEWAGRYFDDWFQPKLFVGTVCVYRDEEECPPLRIGVDSGQWDFLSGLLVGELEKLTDHEYLPEEPDKNRAIDVFNKRFAAFVAQSQRRRANSFFVR